MRKAELEFIKESARRGNVVFYEDILRWGPGELADKIAEDFEAEMFVVVEYDAVDTSLRLWEDSVLARCDEARLPCCYNGHTSVSEVQHIEIGPMQET